MLLQFSVENYLSFDEETTFSLLATADKDHSRHVIEGKPSILRGAAIYGANASGKSNLIAAMEFSRRLIIGGVRPGNSIGVRQFALSKGSQRPTKFEWIFKYEGKVWSYLIEMDTSHVTSESLYARDESGGKHMLFFSRETDEEGLVKFEFGPSLRGLKGSKQEKFLEFVAQGCRREQPFFAEAFERNVLGMYSVLKWFKDCLQIITPKSGWGGRQWSYGSSTDRTNEKAFEPILINNAHFNAFLNKFLSFADTGIHEVIFDKEPYRPEMLPTSNENIVHVIENVSDQRSGGSSHFILFPEDTKMPFMVQGDEEGVWILTPKAVHLDDEGNEHKFPFEWESAGTRRLLHLVPWLFRLYNSPTVLIVDELDQHLHTLLAREFVRLAFDSERNAKGQLVFTTHDTNLLDKELFRRDEIYFVTKNDKGSSRLRSLAEYKVRGDLVYEKGYLLGRFDGIPTFTGAEKLMHSIAEPQKSKAEVTG